MDYENKNQKEFDNYIEQIKELYDKYPSIALSELRKTIKQIGGIPQKEEGKSTIINKKEEQTLTIIIAIVLAFITAIMGFFNIEGLPSYLGGLIFFIAGLAIGLFIPGFGIIFLFSHGMTGLSLMGYSLLAPVLENPIMNDSPDKILIYIGIIISIVIAGIFITILYSLSEKFRNKRFSIFIPILLFMIAIFLCAIAPKIINLIYSL